MFFAETKRNKKGKEIKHYHYKDMMTPYDKLRSLPQSEKYLKLGTNFEILDKIAYQMSDNQAADQMKAARLKLFKTIYGQTLKTG